MAVLGLGRANDREDVRRLQQELNRHGFGPLDVDGLFGRRTRESVKDFQQAFGLDVDGLVGRQTWSALISQEPVRDEGVCLTREFLAAQGGTDLGVDLALVALRDQGAAESGDANHGPQIAHLVDGYREYWGITSSTWPAWCGIAVSSWMQLALGLEGWVLDGRARPLPGHPFGRWFGGVAQIQDWARERGVLLEPDAPARPGMLSLMARGGSGSDDGSGPEEPIAPGRGHVDVVLYEQADGSLLCIGGNLSNQVRVVVRRRSEIHALVDWERVYSGG